MSVSQIDVSMNAPIRHQRPRHQLDMCMKCAHIQLRLLSVLFQIRAFTFFLNCCLIIVISPPRTRSFSPFRPCCTRSLNTPRYHVRCFFYEWDKRRKRIDAAAAAAAAAASYPQRTFYYKAYNKMWREREREREREE